jgi:hypothetical protein
MKKYILSIGCMLSVAAHAQVGLKTNAPTEGLDLNTTIRVRSLPTDGQTNAITTKPDGSKSAAKDQTFITNHVLSTDTNNVLGKSEAGKPMVNTNTEGYEISKRIIPLDTSLPNGTLPVPGSEFTCGGVQMAWGRSPTSGNWYGAIRLAAAPAADVPIPISFEQRYSTNGKEFGQQTHTFAATAPAVVSPATAASVLVTKWDIYQSFFYTSTSINAAAANELNQAFFILPGTTDYYRINILRNINTLSMVCTRF